MACCVETKKHWLWLLAISMQYLTCHHLIALEKLEPPNGCYIGAFIEHDDIVRGDIKLFERLTGKKHATYFTYVGYGSPFPTEWVRKVIEANAIPHIAWEPNDGLDVVKDDEYLRSFARMAGDVEFPIFLRFASEMNGAWTAYFGDPKKYIAKWRLVATVMRNEAPNVVMLWAPFCMPRENIDDYYPGDEFVDWVGVNIYSVYCHDGDPRRKAYFEDPVELLRHVYKTYAQRKPIAIAEYAATHYCYGTKRDTTDFALAKMLRLYNAIASELHRVKMINWLSMDTIKVNRANNYCLTTNSYLLSAYRAIISSQYFLSEPYFGDWFVPTRLLPRKPIRLMSISQALDVPRRMALMPSIRPHEPTAVKPPERSTGAYGITVLGLRNNERVDDSRLIWLYVPKNVKVMMVAYKLNGRVIAITNKSPYYVRINPSNSSETYCLSVIVKFECGESVELPEIRFTTSKSLSDHSNASETQSNG
ncbi:MAG: hypothetical protein RUDDFDWM_002076 [Candidatus Fervidibacterota bacterium]